MMMLPDYFGTFLLSFIYEPISYMYTEKFVYCLSLQKIMDFNKENDSINQSLNPMSSPFGQVTSPGGQLKGTPIRPLTAAYIAARSENEVRITTQEKHQFHCHIYLLYITHVFSLGVKMKKE